MPRSNIFQAGTVSVAELFEGYIEGTAANGSCIALALSARTLSALERNAIEKSLAALGYGRDACTFATLMPADLPDETGAALDAQALFLLVEGLDPICLVAADSSAVQALGKAYRVAYAPDSAIRVFGRPAVAFRDLGSLLATEAGKQTAWRLFKGIPKR